MKKQTNNNEEREEINDEEKQIIIKNDYKEHVYKIQSKYRTFWLFNKNNKNNLKIYKRNW